MTSAETDREKLLVLESQFEDLLKDLRAAETENIQLRAEALSNAARVDQPQGKSIVIHLIETIKILLSIIIVLAGYKYGIQK